MRIISEISVVCIEYDQLILNVEINYTISITKGKLEAYLVIKIIAKIPRACIYLLYIIIWALDASGHYSEKPRDNAGRK